MKTPICKDCHHAPSGRTAEYGAACQCSCHDVADAAPDLLAACEEGAEACDYLVAMLLDSKTGSPEFRERWIEAAHALRTAIAKAKA